MSDELGESPKAEVNSKVEKIEEERQELLTRVASSELSNMRHRVAWLLNQFPSTRNSDIALQIKYWTFSRKTSLAGPMWI